MKLKIETIYRVTREIEVNEESYSNDVLEVEPDAQLSPLKRAQLAMEHERQREEFEIWTDLFCEEVESNGPDGLYHKIVIIDDDGKIYGAAQHDESDYDGVKATL